MAANLREQVHELADHLPDNATWDDLMEEIRFRRAIEAGIKAAERGDFVNKEQVRETFKNWGANIGS